MQVRLVLLAAAAAATLTATASAQTSGGLPFDAVAAPAATAEQPAEYTRPTGRLTPTEIIQQKAQIKAAQRQARIANRAWYGYSQARPTANPIPYSGLYGSQFQGYSLGRPAALFASRPIVVIAR